MGIIGSDGYLVGGPLSRPVQPSASYAGVSAEPARPEMVVKLEETCDYIKALLVRKNTSYSAGKGFTPVRMFSKADTVERINTRLDDKLARFVASGWSLELIDDFIGYLILQRIELVDQGATE